MLRMVRLLRWTVFLGFLGVVGFGVFHFVRYTPRCLIVGPLVVQHLSPDGSRLVTLRTRSKSKRIIATRGPLQFWDTRTGQIVHELFHDERMSIVKSPDGKHAAASVSGKTHLIDLEQGQQWHIDFIDEPKFPMTFSPRGRWLHVGTGQGQPSVIIEVAKRALHRRLTEEFREFGADDRLVLLRQPKDGPIRVFDLTKDGAASTLPRETWQVSYVPDRQQLVLWMNARYPGQQLENGAPAKSWERGLFLWSLEDSRMRYRFDFDRHVDRIMTFSPDRRLMASWQGREFGLGNVEILELATGRRQWQHGVVRPSGGGFSADGALFCFQHGFEKPMVTMLDVATGQVLWERPGEWRAYDRNSGVVFCQESELQQLEFVDERTGITKALSPANFQTTGRLTTVGFQRISPRRTPDGANFVLCGCTVRNAKPFWLRDWAAKRWPEVFGDRREGVLVMETATGRELFRVHNCGANDLFLADNASTLVTLDSVGDAENRFRIRVWDVHPTRAWLWAIAAAAATGFALLALRRLWRKRGARRRTNTSIQPPATSS